MSGVAGSVLGRRNSGLPENYAVEISRLSAEFGNEIGQLLASLGGHRVLFGTGVPFHYPGPALAKLDMLNAPERVKARIRSENAREWLGLGAV